MDLKAFKRSLQEQQTPPTDSLALQALWYEALGRWDQAHELAQQAPGPTGAWVHAFLHRLKGDKRLVPASGQALYQEVGERRMG